MLTNCVAAQTIPFIGDVAAELGEDISREIDSLIHNMLETHDTLIVFDMDITNSRNVVLKITHQPDFELDECEVYVPDDLITNPKWVALEIAKRRRKDGIRVTVTDRGGDPILFTKKYEMDGGGSGFLSFEEADHIVTYVLEDYFKGDFDMPTISKEPPAAPKAKAQTTKTHKGESATAAKAFEEAIGKRTQTVEAMAEDDTILRTLAAALDHHPLLYVSQIISDAGRSHTQFVLSPHGTEEGGVLVSLYHTPRDDKPRAFAVNYSRNGRSRQWFDVPVATIDDLPAALATITENYVRSDEKALDRLVKPKIAKLTGVTRKAVEAAKETTQRLVDEREKERSMGTIYVWPDLRLDEQAVRYDGIWCYLAVVGDKHRFNEHGSYKSAEEATRQAALTLDSMSGSKSTYTIFDQKLPGSVANPEMTRVIVDVPPPEYKRDMEKTQLHFAKPKIDLEAEIDKVIASARKMGDRLMHMGGVADAQALDSYIAQAEAGKTAVRRLAGPLNFGGHGMRNFGFMPHAIASKLPPY